MSAITGVMNHRTTRLSTSSVVLVGLSKARGCCNGCRSYRGLAKELIQVSGTEDPPTFVVVPRVGWLVAEMMGASAQGASQRVSNLLKVVQSNGSESLLPRLSCFTKLRKVWVVFLLWSAVSANSGRAVGHGPSQGWSSKKSLVVLSLAFLDTSWWFFVVTP